MSQGALTARRLTMAIALALASQADAQTCPTPAVADSTQCAVTPGLTVTVGANGTGLTASTGGALTADGITENLSGANATGALARAGGTVSFLMEPAGTRTTTNLRGVSAEGGGIAIVDNTAVRVAGRMVTLAGTQISSAGVDAAALVAGNASISATNVSNSTQDTDNAIGVWADDGGRPPFMTCW
jgi:hypothetical protein